MNWGGTISRKAWIGAGPSLLEAGQSPLGIGQSHHVSDVRSFNPGYLFMCTVSAGGVEVSSCDPGHLLTQVLLPNLSLSSMH